ncbi:MAG TPA: tRNA (adenosine(37)-N6)-threonylcarbamoyltransferase complex ATPase subunit type 1 TsaE [Acidisarcina sp.]
MTADSPGGNAPAGQSSEKRTGTHRFDTHSSAETIAAGREIAKLLTPPRLLILRGDLGAGKTTLVKGIAEALEAAEPEEVTSPTFTLIHEYEGSRSVDGVPQPVFLYHLDLYRLEQERQLDTLGLDELIAPDSILLVEWGEKFPSVVKRSNGEIVVKSAGGDTRKITLTLGD